MPDGVADAIEPDEFEWHDGNLVDLQFLFGGMIAVEASRFEFTKAGS